MPQISIIVPVFNTEAQISKCIESIISQTFQNWELILIDDGSSDKSGAICDLFASNDNRIKVVHKQNEGVSIARNVGLCLALGKYVCFIDSDDYVGVNYLSSMLNLINDENTIIYGNVCHIRSGKKTGIAFSYVTGTIIDKSNINHYLEKYNIQQNGFPVAKLFPKSVIVNNHLHFNPDLSLHEDHIFVLQALSSIAKIILCNEAEYFYVHQDSGNSLSQKRHPSSHLLAAAKELIYQNSVIFEQFSISDNAYKSRVFTLLGLNQIIKSYLTSSPDQESEIIREIINKKNLFKKYYRPNHRIIRIIPKLAIFRLNIILSWIKRLFGARI